MLGGKLTSIFGGFGAVSTSFRGSTGSNQLVRLDVQGTKQVADALRALPIELEVKINLSTMRKVLTPLKDAISRNIPIVSGNLSRSVRKTVSKSRKMPGKVYGEVKAVGKSRDGVSKDKEKGFHAHLFEFGFRLTGHKKGAKRAPYGYPRTLRKVDGRHVFRNALNSQADSIVAEFYRVVGEKAKEAQAKIKGIG